MPYTRMYMPEKSDYGFLLPEGMKAEVLSRYPCIQMLADISYRREMVRRQRREMEQNLGYGIRLQRRWTNLSPHSLMLRVQ